eukprot:gnl/TRDRNA2_/TRDRNA2_139396_c0_seq1.p1 gnl/TRDRNA2_/TRDRNA2_139396_c0~~gnl/TRDRNA2_/TRDRNA2_139396_c0_seq1.p1  ORF type:complete len:305 (-),score=72.72 gnl/TRDRNA2_/TRDRNA2_139396_c0_seq1:186-998(-)
MVPNANIKALVLDLASLDSIRSFPEKYHAALGNTPLDVLMENAGVMAIPERVLTTDGFEKQIGVNHLGHFALVAVMMPTLRKAAKGFRIIIVSSTNHVVDNGESVMRAALAQNLDPKNYSQWGAYGISKAANVMFAKELQRRFEAAGIRGSAVSLHPGGVQTDLIRYVFQGVQAAEMGVPLQETLETINLEREKKGKRKIRLSGIPVEEGANTQVYLAAAADSRGDLTQNGGEYFSSMEVATPAAFVNNPELAKKLWETSVLLTGTNITI